MRLFFSDMVRIKKTARENVESGIAGLKRWWSKKYKLPPNHELFLNQNIGELNLEMYEDWMVRKDELEDLMLNRPELFDPSQMRGMQRELDSLNAALGENDFVEDDLIDKWERELAEGKTPDLTEGLNVA